METIIYFLAGIGIAIGAFLFFEKPHYLIGLLVFMMVYIFNIGIPGPLDARGLILLMLFVRIVILDRENLSTLFNTVFKNPYFIFITLFILMMAIVTYSFELNLKISLKLFLLSVISILMGYYIISNEASRKAFIIAVVAAGVLSVFDLVVHYWQFGGVSNSLNIFRPLDIISTRALDKKSYVNHNFPGMLAGLAFLVVYIIHKKKIWTRIFTYSLMFILIGGVFLSTSRSTIVAIVAVIFLINFYSTTSTINYKKLVLTLIMIVFFYSTFYFVYNIFFEKTKYQENLVNMIYYRLYEEPLELMGSGDKQFDKYSGESKEGSIRFRFDKASHDVTKFFSKDIISIAFGFGKGGYKYIGQRRFGEGGVFSYILAPHNGYVMILIENGLLGLIIFLLFSIGLIIKSIRYQSDGDSIPIGYIYLGLAIFSVAQNSELTSTLSFLLIGGMISDVIHPYFFDEEDEEFEDEFHNETNDHLTMNEIELK